MLCDNCGENEANVRYTQIINGVKKEMRLCEKCSKELGIGGLDFNMPINLSSFLGDFFEDEKEFLPSFGVPEKLICSNCGMTYDDFVNTGKFGCENCYEVFSDRIDKIIKNIHGGNRHIGRGILQDNKQKTENINTNIKGKIVEQKQENTKLNELKESLKEAIKEERYEDAAKLRDEIKKLEK